MRLRVLGCSGGIGGNLHTTSFLLDRDVLIDAGTGVSELSLSEMSAIDHIFITHSHLDHIACIPMLVDSVWMMRAQPITIYAIRETIEILRKHIFNWSIWPDFAEVPSGQQPSMRYREIALGESVNLNGRSITALPANHVVPAVGFQLDSGDASLVYSGDTTVNDELWQIVNNIANLRYLLIEAAFSNSERQLAELSKHLCPSMLAEELTKFKKLDVDVFITHLKPGELEQTMHELEEAIKGIRPRMLMNNQEFVF
ncbi:MAG: 3',5'-cyclic-nucleotide phosphodiesterase [Gallionella sp.]